MGLPWFLRYLVEPYGVFHTLSRRYGDTFCLRLPGTQGTVATQRPEGTLAILSADDTHLEPWRIAATVAMLTEDSIFLQRGEQHRAARRLLHPLLSPTRIRSTAMAEITERHLQATGSGEVAVHALAQRITLDVILDALFSIRGERTAPYHELLLNQLDSLGPAFLYLSWLRFGGGPFQRALRILDQLRLLVRGEIAARRASRHHGGDMLGALLDAQGECGAQLSEQRLCVYLADMIIAGFETTAVAIAWACYELCRSPPVLARLLDELRGLSRLEGPHGAELATGAAPYLEAVCHEALRLHPPLPFLTRMLRRPLEVAGYTVPAGMGVSLLVECLHTRPELYPDPSRFWPSRFLGRVMAPHHFMPFGGGVKRCLGAGFALREMTIVIAALLRRFQMQLCMKGAARAVPRTITIAPAGGIRVRLTRRGSLSSASAGRAPSADSGAQSDC